MNTNQPVQLNKIKDDKAITPKVIYPHKTSNTKWILLASFLILLLVLFYGWRFYNNSKNFKITTTERAEVKEFIIDKTRNVSSYVPENLSGFVVEAGEITQRYDAFIDGTTHQYALGYTTSKSQKEIAEITRKILESQGFKKTEDLIKDGEQRISGVSKNSTLFISINPYNMGTAVNLNLYEKKQ